MKRVKLRLVAIIGPEFAKEKDCSASCVHGKPPRRLQTDFPHQVLAATPQCGKTRSLCRSGVSRCSSSGCNQVDQVCEDLSSNPWKRPFLQHNPFNWWRIQDQSHAARQDSNLAAIPSERSLQLRVNRAQPPRGEADPLRHTTVPIGDVT